MNGHGHVRLRVNGRPYELSLDPRMSLLDCLRDHHAPDPQTPLGAKGIGELGIVGVAAALQRDLPRHRETGPRPAHHPDKLM